MTVRHVTTALAVAGLVTAMAAPASATTPAQDGRKGVTAITKVYTFGQKVAAVAIEYPDEVNPHTLDRNTFTVSDSIYNFRFSPLENLQKREDRTVTRLYTNDRPAIDSRGRSDRGRFVIVELGPEDPDGNTVIRSKCSGFLCSEKINPALPTEVIQNENIHGKRHRRVLAPGGPARHPLTRKPINLFADEFHYRTFDFNGTAVPYAYHLPAQYNPRRAYPLVVVLPGWVGVRPGERGGQVVVDITVTAWLQPRWTGSREDVIVLSPQTQRIGVEAESAALMALLDSFMVRHRVDQDRVYVSTFSWGSMLAYDTMSKRPGLFDAALINAGFRINPDQAARAATVRIPFWITHGTSDPVLPVGFGRDTTRILRAAYVAAGVDPAEAEDLVRFTEYPDEAYSLPDYHAVVGPTYEDGSALLWLLDQ